MYFDPGMGSLIIQAVIAAIAVLGGYWIAAKTKFKDFFRKKSDKTSTAASEKADGEGGQDDTL